MIFIILCILVLAVGFFVALRDYEISFSILESLFCGLIWAAVSALPLGVILCVLCSVIPANDKTEDAGTENLQALSISSSITGRFSGGFFVSSGYVDGMRTLNFVARQADGGFRVDAVWAVNSRIYEGNDKPTISTTFHSYSNGWLIPWDVRNNTTYRFDVPKGSVLEGYTVDNAGGN